MTDEKWAYEIEGKLEIPYRYFAGEFDSRFLTTLRDEKKILGCRCPDCKKVFMPPRSSCEVCFTKIEEWVEVGPAGTVTSWTTVRYKEPYLPAKPPYILALIRLDGADTSLAHIIKGVLPEKMETGMRVEAVFADERKASITDISHFRPIAAPAKKAAAKKPAKKKPASKKAAQKKKASKPKPKKKALKPKRKVAKKKAAKPRSKPAKKRAIKKPARKKKSAPKRKPAKKAAKKKPARKRKAAGRKKALKKPAKRKPAKKKAVKAKKAGGRKSAKKRTKKAAKRKPAKRKAAKRGRKRR